MLKCEMTVACETILNDNQSKNISIINILENLQPEGFPVFIPKIEVFNLFAIEGNDEKEFSNVKISVKIDDDLLISNNLGVNFHNSLRNRNIFRIQGLLIPHPGKLSFEVYQDEILLNDYFINIQKVDPQTTEIESR